jgi:MOSC domain-containing protein YiiM
MFQGQLIGIFVSDKKCEELRSVEQAEAVPGRGIAGDRYERQEGTFSTKPGPDREVTLIEIEALDALQRESEITLKPAHARRNLLTRDVPLNHLVGREFTVGAVVLHGLRLCEPCGHLEGLTVLGVNKGLTHRGGLRARVVRGGVLRTGDLIRPAEGAIVVDAAER